MEQKKIIKLSSGYKPLMFLSLALFVLFNFIQLNMMNVLSVYLVKMFNINPVKLGFVGSAYFYTNLACIFFAGLLLDSFSPKKIVLFAITISFVTLIFFTFIPCLYSLIIWRLSGGIACAFSIAGAVKIISEHFPANKRGLMIGLIGMVSTIAGVVSQLPLSFSLQNYGMHFTFLVIAAVGFVAFLLICLTVENNFTKKHTNFSQILNSTYKIFFNLKNMCAAFFECFINLPLFVLGALWGSLYLIKTHNVNENIAAIMVSMLFFGHMLGAPFFGFLADKLNSRKLLLFIGSGLALASVILINSLSPSPLQSIFLLFVFFLLGFSTGTQIVTDAFVVQRNSEGVARAISLLSLISVSGGAIFQPLFGFIVQYSQDPISGYQHGMQLLLYTSIVALIIGLFIPNKNRNIEHKNKHQKVQN